MSLLKYLPPSPPDKYGWPWTEETDPELYNDISQWPKISIITTGYNHGAFLEEAIRSVLLQNYPKLEYCIVDNESTDSTVEIIKKYEKFLTSWEFNLSADKTTSKNRGVEIASGDIFNWLDADDYYNPRTFYTIANLFIQNKSIDLVSGRYQYYTSDNSLDEIIPKIKLESSLGKIMLGLFAIPPTFIKTESIKRMMPFNTLLNCTWNVEFWHKYFLMFGIKNIKPIEDILVNSRNHDKLKSEVKKDDMYRDKNSLPAIELNSIFYSIAMKNNFHKESMIIKDLTSSLISDYSLNFDFSGYDQSSIKSIIDNYLFMHALIFYQNGLINKSRILFGCIHSDSLEKEDKFLFHKCYLKSFFPSIINFKRKF